MGLVYLDGNGRMTFTHDATGKETVVEVKPDRFLSLDNAQYTHKLEAGSIPRRILGPMAFRDGIMQSIGDQYACAMASCSRSGTSPRAYWSKPTCRR